MISKIQDRKNIAKWKVVYSQVNNAFNKVYAENSDTFAEPDVKDEFWNHGFIMQFANQLDIVDKCAVVNLSGYSRCNPATNKNAHKYFGITSSGVARPYKTLAGGSIGSYDYKGAAFLLKNGAAVYIGGLFTGPAILVDVNNYSVGPNVLGRDVFAINCIPAYSCSMLLPMGAQSTYKNTPYVYNGNQTACSKDIGLSESNSLFEAAGAGCAAKYLLE